VLSNLTIKGYFSLTDEKKRGLSFLTLKMVKTAIKSRATYTDKDLIELLGHLINKNDSLENYELSDILKNTIINFSVINDLTQPKTRKAKIKKESDDN